MTTTISTTRLRRSLGALGLAAAAVVGLAAPASARHPIPVEVEPADTRWGPGACDFVKAGPCGSGDYWPHGFPIPDPSWPPVEPL